MIEECIFVYIFNPRRFLNSRTAIAGAIIGLLLVFYNSNNLNCIGALCFYYDSKRSIGEVLFLMTLVGVNFEAGNEPREKFWEWFGC